MKSYQRIIITIIPAILLASCTKVSQPFDAALKSTGSTADRTDSAAMRRFKDTNTDDPTAVESAIELSKKYAVLSEKMTALRLEKQVLADENSHLKQQIGLLEKDLKQTQKELGESNDLLIEMRIELNNWKTDILGFRDEIRKADKAQLETLVKILKVLGGEVIADTSLEYQSSDKSE